MKKETVLIAAALLVAVLSFVLYFSSPEMLFSPRAIPGERVLADRMRFTSELCRIPQNGVCGEGEFLDNGCCVKARCVDTDGGEQPSVWGGAGYEGHMSPMPYSDFCAGEQLTEYVCGADGLVESRVLSCEPGSCVEGRCTVCGDGTIEGNEECEADNFGNYGDGVNACASYLGNPGAEGNLGCSECKIESSSCILPVVVDGVCDPHYEDHFNNPSECSGPYYIVDMNNPFCSDNGPGTQDTPYCSLNKAAMVVNPGDTVYIRGGVQKIVSYFSFLRGGSPGQWVTIRNFPGEDPILESGVEFLTTWDVLEQTNEYTIYRSANSLGTDSSQYPTSLIIGLRNPLSQLFSLDQMRGMPTVDSSPTFDAYYIDCSDGHVYVRLQNVGEDLNNLPIFTMTSNRLVVRRSYIRFLGLTMQHGTEGLKIEKITGVSGAEWEENVQHVHLYDSVIRSVRMGIGDQANSFAENNFTFDGNHILNIGPIAQYYLTGSNQYEHLSPRIQCLSQLDLLRNGQFQREDGTFLPADPNVAMSIKHNRWDHALYGARATGTTFSNNYVYMGGPTYGVGAYHRGKYFNNIIFGDIYGASDVPGKQIEIYNNVIVSDHGFALHLRGEQYGSIVKHNLFVAEATPSDSTAILIEDTNAPAANVTFVDNIVLGRGSHFSTCIALPQNPDYSQLVMDYNVYGGCDSLLAYDSLGSRRFFLDEEGFNAWQAFSSPKDTHSLLGDLNGIINEEYRLTPRSIAIDRGMCVSVLEDIEGNARPQNAVCDIGPYEYTYQCGDGLHEGIEECDDGNLIDEDGCDSTCVVESSWHCSGDPSTCIVLDHCARCGALPGALCSKEQCEAIEEGCFYAGFNGVTACRPCATITDCRGYGNDQAACEAIPDACSFGACAWNGQECTQCGNSICEYGENSVSCSADCEALAFPEAEGFGKFSVGGRGDGLSSPQVVFVDTLSDTIDPNDGVTSLREAVAMSGPRFILFKVGGVITLNSPLEITNPYLTIAGQTAPDPGITLAQYGMKISTHDIVVRYVKIRNYKLQDDDSNAIYGVNIRSDSFAAPVDNVILDHISTAWGTSGNIMIGGITKDITVQNSFVSETPTSSNGAFTAFGYPETRLTMHHNLFAHTNEYMPQIASVSVADIRNNIAYNWRNNQAIKFSTAIPQQVNLVNNWYIDGRNVSEPSPLILVGAPGTTNPLLYLSGNFGPERRSEGLSEWDIGVVYYDGNQYQNAPQSVYGMSAPVAAENVETQPVLEAYDSILESAGASFPRRDLLDERTVDEIKYVREKYTGNGGPYDIVVPRYTTDPLLRAIGPSVLPSAEAVASLGVEVDGLIIPDTDQDGISDSYEMTHGLSRFDPHDALLDSDGDGYLNIEEYINELPNTPQCSDGFDNDLDGYCDTFGSLCEGIAGDAGCATESDDEERICGDGHLDKYEACDDGNTQDGDGCDSRCVVEYCGDGVTNNAPYEQCDDGNLNSDTLPDACREDCSQAICGDGIRDTGEECDKGGVCKEDRTKSCMFDSECSSGQCVTYQGAGCTLECTVMTNWVCNNARPNICQYLSACSDCGLFFGIGCTRSQCEGISEDSCFYESTGIFGTCSSCGGATSCFDYASDEQSCQSNQCGFVTCSFEENTCVPTCGDGICAYPEDIRSCPADCEALAFPEAEGFGKYAAGGRGDGLLPSQVIIVDTLSDTVNLNDGRVSLREAVSQSGPRFVLFNVSGIIHLESPLVVSNPYITIAGQSAPDPGITLARHGMKINTSEVIVRYIKVRNYNLVGDLKDNMFGIQLKGESSISHVGNVIIDHVSTAWGQNANIVGGGSNYLGDITIQNSVMAEATTNSYGGAYLLAIPGARISMHHNLFAQNKEGNPLVGTFGKVDVRNNIIYNWANQPTSISSNSGQLVNLINNWYIEGKSVPDAPPNPLTPLISVSVPAANNPKIFLSGNIGSRRVTQTQNEWDVFVAYYQGGWVAVNPALYGLSTETPVEPVTTQPVEQAFNTVISSAGANFPRRDLLDQNLINEVNYVKTTYRSPTNPLSISVPQFPQVPDPLLHAVGPSQIPSAAAVAQITPPSSGTVIIDTDRDGMPNVYETLSGFDPNDPSDALEDVDTDGYLNIEEYLNNLV